MHAYVPYVSTSAASTTLWPVSAPEPPEPPPAAARRRSTLPHDEARRRYVELAELVVLEQIHADARRLDAEALAVGPFARLDANAVAAREGKTRGAVTNLFGSQAAFQAAAMALALDAGEPQDHPAPEDHPDADAWVAALFASAAERGPRHGAPPARGYAALWALWLAAVPYGLWSERVSGPSMEEYRATVATLEAVLGRALEHFGLRLRRDVTLTDLATACASAIEGAWLNQCLTAEHPAEPDTPVAEALVRAGRLLWRGATEPAAT